MTTELFTAHAREVIAHLATQAAWAFGLGLAIVILAKTYLAREYEKRKRS